MAAPRRLVRVALEIEETDLEEIQRLIEEYNAIFSPLKLSVLTRTYPITRIRRGACPGARLRGAVRCSETVGVLWREAV